MLQTILRFLFFIFTFVFGIFLGNAQQITGKIIDSETNESIAYATIRVGETDLISNDNGYFTISGENASDRSLLSISFIGYAPQKISVSDLKANNNIIKLVMGAYDIGGISISNVKPNPNDIMKLVNENLSSNYKGTDIKTTFFLRESSNFVPKKLELEITKATDLSKSERNEINKEIETLINKSVGNSVKTYSDVLSDFYRVTNDNKSEYKLDVKKAIVLKDVNRSSGYEELQKSSSNVFLRVMDTTKFYRIKSGLIGSRDTISFSKEYNKKNKAKQDKKDEKLKASKSDLESIISQSSFTNTNYIDFVKETDIYNYTYVEATYLGNDLVYVIDFTPKKSKARYSGRLYINDTDYAIVRADYKLADGKKHKGINLKLLLGVKMSEGLNKGIVIYKKNPETSTYQLHYSLQDRSQYFYLNRPIKFIELTEGREKDKIAYTIKTEGNNFDKTEFLNISTQSISKSEFESFNEKEFEVQVLSKYDPNIWKGYNVIEPLEEMKKFEVVAE